MSQSVNLPNLPIGIQTFAKLRRNGDLYVDKTAYLARLIDAGGVYFFSRPRRFGKSLTVTTLDAIFSGQKELFKDLAIESRLDDERFTARPVIRLDMSMVATDSGIEALKQSLARITWERADILGLRLDPDLPHSAILRNLIQASSRQAGRPVTVLIDEYDKPYLDFFDQPNTAGKVREIMRNYYTQIKAADEYIGFVFITGISKFSRMGVFSAMNNIKDISILPEYGAMCGYTHEEMLRYFDAYIDETARHLELDRQSLLDKVRDYYDGFCFDGQTMLYNPFSTLQFFADKRFFNYWFESGTASFISKYLRDRHLTVEQFRGLTVDNAFARNPGEIDKATPESFLYQSGYLSLRPTAIDGFFTLDYPNYEVLKSMSALLMSNFFGDNVQAGRAGIHVTLALKNGDAAEVIRIFNALFARIPYDDYTRARQKDAAVEYQAISFGEWLYRSTLLSFLIGAGLRVEAETHSSQGRADMIVHCQDTVWVMEIKISRAEQNNEALAAAAYQQIIDKGYAKPFVKPMLLAFVINDETKSIGAWKTNLPEKE